jgi:hypothetical protein
MYTLGLRIPSRSRACGHVGDDGAGAAVDAGFCVANARAEDPGMESCTCHPNPGADGIAFAPNGDEDVSTAGWLTCCSDASAGEIASTPIS